MSYHRGEPYVWTDGYTMHLWSNRRDGEDANHPDYKSRVVIDLEVFDQIVIKRFLALLQARRLPKLIERVLWPPGTPFPAMLEEGMLRYLASTKKEDQ